MSDTVENGGVVVEEMDGEPEFRRVKMYCVGCGELIDEFEAFADEAERLEGEDSIHDSLECRRKAQQAQEAEEA